jgi:hypothetical protein
LTGCGDSGGATAAALGRGREASGEAVFGSEPRRCHNTTAATTPAKTTATKSAKRRERVDSDGDASQSVRVPFSGAMKGVTTLTFSSSVSASPLIGEPGLCSVRSEEVDLSARDGRIEAERRMPEMRETEGCERGANGASASASSATVW